VAVRAPPVRTEPLLARPDFERARLPIVEADSDFKLDTLDLALRLLLALTGLRFTLLSLFFLGVEEESDISISDADADLDGLRRLRVLSDAILSDVFLSGIKPPFR